MSDVKQIKYQKNISKFELAEQILENAQNEIKKELQQIVTCGLKCDTECPIWNFTDNNPLLIKVTKN